MHARELWDFVSPSEPFVAYGEDKGKDAVTPIVPFLGVVFYLVGKKVLDVVCNALGTNGKSTGFAIFMFLHNLALSLYSAASAVWCIWVVGRSFATRGFKGTYCDAELWDEGVGFAAYLFYLSKYYEYVDTAILIVKRKPVSYLQTYHHAGAVLSMWMAVVSHSQMSWVFVTLNSVIHAFMYAYYALLSLPGPKPPTRWKKTLTTCQIVQFGLGNTLVLPCTLQLYDCYYPAQVYAVWIVQAYTIGLVALFLHFFRQTYIKSKGRAGGGGAPVHGQAVNGQAALPNGRKGKLE
eukprot:jgi/Mesvir1/1733/Mv21185-RA.1